MERLYKNLTILFCMILLLGSCTEKKVVIGVSQCCGGLWREKVNKEMRLAQYQYKNVDLLFATAENGSVEKYWGCFFLFHGILYLCIMNILEQLARLVLPKEILDNFDIVKIETDESNIDSMSMTIHLDERMNAYLQKSEEYESKGFMDAVRITDFPIRDHKVILVLRRRRWRNKETGETFVDRISVTESGTRYSKEFAAFLKETYGHIPDDLPYA